jgi:hypothetical protein
MINKNLRINKIYRSILYKQFCKKDLSMPFVERTNTYILFITVKEDFRIL